MGERTGGDVRGAGRTSGPTRATTAGAPADARVAVADDDVVDPRVARSRRVVLEAAAALLAECGVHGASIEAIAARSGVAKTTIYRHWDTRAAVLVDAVGCLAEAVPEPDTGSLRDDLRVFLGGLAARLSSPSWGPLLAALIDAAERDPELARLHREFGARRRERLRAVLERGAGRGQLPADTDLDLLVEALVGPLFYRRFVGRLPVDDEVVARLVDTALARPPRLPSRRPERAARRPVEP